MGLEIEYTDSKGRKHKDMAGMLESDVQGIIDGHLDSTRKAIESQRCDIHGERPTVSVSRSGDEVSFDISGCCQDLVEKARSAAGAVNS